MSVLIRGMDLPEKCGLCKIFRPEHPMRCAITGTAPGAPYGMPRPEWCPLEEVSDNGKVREIGFAECANALLKMWIDNVVTDGEYNRIASKLHKYWTGRGAVMNNE